jgi:hypothetical protein
MTIIDLVPYVNERKPVFVASSVINPDSYKLEGAIEGDN